MNGTEEKNLNIEQFNKQIKTLPAKVMVGVSSGQFFEMLINEPPDPESDFMVGLSTPKFYEADIKENYSPMAVLWSDIRIIQVMGKNNKNPFSGMIST